MSPLQPLLESLESIGEEIKRNDGFYRVITHVDADGIGAGVTLFRTLYNLGREVHISFVRDLTREEIFKIFEEDFDVVIFSDMGSSSLDEISYWASRKGVKAIVLDHHVIPGEIPENVSIANPWLFQMSGDKEACASSLALYLAVNISESNWIIASFAFAGMLGDVQLQNPVGLNQILLEEALRKGVLIEKKEGVLRGERVLDALAYTLPPYLKGLTGNPEKCSEILRKYGIPEYASLIGLNSPSLKILNSIVVLKLLEQGLTYDEIEELFRPRYWASNPFPAYVDEIAGCLSSLGNLGEYHLAIEMSFGEERAIKKARELAERVKVEIIEGLKDLERNLRTLKAIQYYFCPKPSLKSPIASYGAAYIINPDKVLIVLSEDSGGYRVSARCRRKLVEEGIDLSEVMRRTCLKFRGHGGGHKIAAGGFFKGDAMEFLRTVDLEVRRQLGVEDEGEAKAGGKLPI